MASTDTASQVGSGIAGSFCNQLRLGSAHPKLRDPRPQKHDPGIIASGWPGGKRATVAAASQTENHDSTMMRHQGAN